jgi:hypothetical protein
LAGPDPSRVSTPSQWTPNSPACSERFLSGDLCLALAKRQHLRLLWTARPSMGVRDRPDRRDLRTETDLTAQRHARIGSAYRASSLCWPFPLPRFGARSAHDLRFLRDVPGTVCRAKYSCPPGILPAAISRQAFLLLASLALASRLALQSGMAAWSTVTTTILRPAMRRLCPDH